jgi:hypothetical protein
MTKLRLRHEFQGSLAADSVGIAACGTYDGNEGGFDLSLVTSPR